MLQAPESDSTETPLTIWRHAWIENRCFDLPTQTAIVKDTSSPSDPIGIRIKHLMDHYSCDRFHLYFPQPLDSTFDPPPSAESTESQYAHLESIKAVKEPQLPPDHVVVTYVSKAPSALPQSGHEVRSYQPAQKPRWSQKQLRAAEKCIERGVKCEYPVLQSEMVACLTQTIGEDFTELTAAGPRHCGYRCGFKWFAGVCVHVGAARHPRG